MCNKVIWKPFLVCVSLGEPVECMRVCVCAYACSHDLRCHKVLGSLAINDQWCPCFVLLLLCYPFNHPQFPPPFLLRWGEWVNYFSAMHNGHDWIKQIDYYGHQLYHKRCICCLPRTRKSLHAWHSRPFKCIIMYSSSMSDVHLHKSYQVHIHTWHPRTAIHTYGHCTWLLRLNKTCWLCNDWHHSVCSSLIEMHDSNKIFSFAFHGCSMFISPLHIPITISLIARNVHTLSYIEF